MTPPPSGGDPRPGPAAFRLGVTERNWLDNDRLARSKLGYKWVRFDGDIALHAPGYKQDGVTAVKLESSSADWARLRDSWNAYGPNGTVVPGVVTMLELGNEEAYAYKTADPYRTGRVHGQAVRQLKAAAPGAPIVCQGDDGNRGTDAFFRGMRDANARIAQDCALYSIHPYTDDYRARMERNRRYIRTVLGDQDPFAVTEWGVSVRLDAGAAAHANAAARLREVGAYLKARGDVAWATLFQNTDQQTNSANREHNFGLLSSHQTGEQPKGAYTAAFRELAAANP